MKNLSSPYLSMTARNEHQEKVLEGVGIWAAYYRNNIHRFAIDYLHLQLHLFQMIILVMMNICTTFVFIGFRGIGKSFICAVFCCARCILYPGTKVCIASGTRGQSINVLEKILTELKPLSPELASEINEKETNINNTDAKIVFRNGSYIKVVTASDSARSNRANLLIIDEYRMVKKHVVNTILRRFLAAPRHPKYLDKPEYKSKKELREHNVTMYFSSAYYKDHWSFLRAKDSCRFMLDETKHNFVCGFPYQLGIAEDMLSEEEVIEQMLETDFNEIDWSMEMDSVFYGDSNGSFFGFDVVSRNRHIEYAMLPDSLSSKWPLATKLRITPKQPGEKRLLSADIALMATTRHKNDATAIFINQLLPTKAMRYSSNIVYTESNEGLHTEEQALRIRRLYEEYDCDYIVLDTRNIGLSIYDILARDITDPDSGEVYPALSCVNNPDLAIRCVDKNAKKAVWAVAGSSKFNSDCAIALREGFRTGRIRLLSTEYDAEDVFGNMRGYGALSVGDRMAILLPYINTTLLINELINLQHEETAGVIRLFEKGNLRKDRYSSLSYNYYVATQIEKTLRKDTTRSQESKNDAFIFRAPVTKLHKGR